MGEGPTIPLLHLDHWVPFSQRESTEPSLFHYQPLPSQDITSGYATIQPVQGTHNYTRRPEASNPPPLNLGETSTSNPTGGHHISRGTSPMGPVYQSPLHIGTIPLAVNLPSTPLPPIGPPSRTHPTQPIMGYIPTQGHQPIGYNL